MKYTVMTEIAKYSIHEMMMLSLRIWSKPQGIECYQADGDLLFGHDDSLAAQFQTYQTVGMKYAFIQIVKKLNWMVGVIRG